ncbi:MAG: PaaI family thioesterase [Actinomycetota bacterium]|nr:PaaI family thioesterase [Actinomycetota bacterium]
MDETAREAGILLADEIRALMLDLHQLEVSGNDLEEAARHLRAARAAIDGPTRLRWYEIPNDRTDDETRQRVTGEARDYSLFRGDRNPVAPPLRVATEVHDDGSTVVVGEVRVDRCHEGPPGRIHGGYLAGLFDDVLSGTIRLAGDRPAVTARLKLRYRQLTPIEADLRFEAWLVSTVGRRLISRARCLADGTLTAEAEALFVFLPRSET